MRSTILFCLTFFLAGLSANMPNCEGQSQETQCSTNALKVSSTTLTGYATFYTVRSCQKERWGNRQPIMANGKPLDDSALTCALPLETVKAWKMKWGDKVRVINLNTGESVIVIYLDRGPGRKSRSRGTIIDLTPAAFVALGGKLRDGKIKVKVEDVK